MKEPKLLEIVVLAAGKGTRMRSAKPKVLQPIGGRPMLAHVLQTAEALSPHAIHVVVGHQADLVRAAFAEMPLNWHLQAEQLGTGHAVAQTSDSLNPDARALILYGDVPLITPETLQNLLVTCSGNEVGLLTALPASPDGYGRIVRDGNGQVERIVEHKDADAELRKIREVNTGILTAMASDLTRWLAQLSNNNAQGEYYLTDVIGMAVAEGIPVRTYTCPDPIEAEGVNNRLQQAVIERAYQRREAERLMNAGVTLMDPDRIDIRGQVSCGQDVVIDVGVILEGNVTLEDGVKIGANSVVRNTRIGAGSEIKPHTVIDGAVIEAGVSVGPFARIRPDTTLKTGAAIGNFVEVKKSVVGEGSKAGHLAYLGDAVIGRNVNIGAGTITCNYDGANKHQTVLQDDVFVGSDTQLVAPVTVGEGATIGAGTTVTQDVPNGVLVVSRVRQKHISGWQRPTKRKKQEGSQ